MFTRRYGERWDVRELFTAKQMKLMSMKLENAVKESDKALSVSEFNSLGLPGPRFSCRERLPEPKPAAYLDGSLGGADLFGALSVAHVLTEIVHHKMAKKLKEEGWKVDFPEFVNNLGVNRCLLTCAHKAAPLILEHASTKGIPVRGPENRSGVIRIQRCGFVMKCDSGLCDRVSVGKAMSSPLLGHGPVLLGVLTPGYNFEKCTDEKPYWQRSTNYGPSRAVLCTGAVFLEEESRGLLVECYDHRPHGENGEFGLLVHLRCIKDFYFIKKLVLEEKNT